MNKFKRWRLLNTLLYESLIFWGLMFVALGFMILTQGCVNYHQVQHFVTGTVINKYAEEDNGPSFGMGPGIGFDGNFSIGPKMYVMTMNGDMEYYIVYNTELGEQTLKVDQDEYNSSSLGNTKTVEVDEWVKDKKQ